MGSAMLSASAASAQTHMSSTAQAYPNKPVRIVTTSPGGGSDFTARIIAQGLTAALNQPVIVENRGGGLSAVESVARAQRDGYTLMLYANTMWITPFLQKVSYDPVKDFATITTVGVSPQVLIVHPSVAATSIKQLIALAKAKPGALNYSSSGTASPPHLTAEYFKALTGADLTHIPYKGSGPAITALLASQVQIAFAAAGSVMAQVKAERLRALGVTSLEPSILVPGVPTIASSGLPGFEAISIFGMWAPAATPTAAINRLNKEIAAVLGRTDVKEKFINNGFEAAVTSPAQFAVLIKTDTAKWGKVIKDSGIKGE